METSQVFLGPQGYGAADNLEDVIVDFIDGAEESLEIAVQELELAHEGIWSDWSLPDPTLDPATTI